MSTLAPARSACSVRLGSTAPDVKHNGEQPATTSVTTKGSPRWPGLRDILELQRVVHEPKQPTTPPEPTRETADFQSVREHCSAAWRQDLVRQLRKPWSEHEDANIFAQKRRTDSAHGRGAKQARAIPHYSFYITRIVSAKSLIYNDFLGLF